MNIRNFADGIINLVSDLWNSRQASAANTFVHTALTHNERTALIMTGLGGKICTIKSARALDDTIQFDSKSDQEYYEDKLDDVVQKAAKWAVGYGRGIVVLHRRGDRLDKPLGRVEDPDTILFSVFDGGIVTPHSVDLDLQSTRYNKPSVYAVKGAQIHHSRVVDFTYTEPPEILAPVYQYGGVSIFDQIYDQLIADGVIQRACPQVVDKASTMFYRVKGFKAAMQAHQHTDMVNYFKILDKTRGIMAAGLVDQEDEVVAVNQSIANLGDADNITLRRLAMVTSIPITVLVGENARGMNSSGDNEQSIFQEALETEQKTYWKRPINELMRKLGKGPIRFKENQGETPMGRVEYESKAIDNAIKLNALGEDGVAYLVDKDVVKQDDYGELFDLSGSGTEEPDDGMSPDLEQIIASVLQGEGGGDGQA